MQVVMKAGYKKKHAKQHGATKGKKKNKHGKADKLAKASDEATPVVEGDAAMEVAAEAADVPVTGLLHRSVGCRRYLRQVGL